MSIQLNQVAMLAGLSISSWTARKHDKKISQEVASNHDTTEKAGRYNKNLLPFEAESYKAVQQAAGAARAEHYEQTLPWTDEGSRILPSTNYMEYTNAMRQKRTVFNDAVENFISDYPALRMRAKLVLNGMFREEDYPQNEKMKDKFSMTQKFYPIPDAQDFRVKLHDTAVQAIKNQLEADQKDMATTATRYLYEGLKELVDKIHERLSNQDSHFKDSLIDNLRAFCERLPRLNLTNDPQLEEYRKEIVAGLTVFQPDLLRTNEVVRNTVAARAAEIQEAMACYMGVAA